MKKLTSRQVRDLCMSRQLHERFVYDVETIVLAMQEAAKPDQPAAEPPSPQLEMAKAEPHPELPEYSQNPDGLYRRYVVTKVNGDPVDERAVYFVLRLDHYGGDPHHIEACRFAMRHYARALKSGCCPRLEQLANDVESLLGRLGHTCVAPFDIDGRAETRIAELEARNVELTKRVFELREEVNAERNRSEAAEAKSSKPSNPPQIENTLENRSRFVSAAAAGLPMGVVGDHCLKEANKILAEQHARQ